MAKDPESKDTVWYYRILHDGWKIKAFTLKDREILEAQVSPTW
jgi:hypothetical protein